MDAGDVNGAYNLGLLCAEQGAYRAGRAVVPAGRVRRAPRGRQRARRSCCCRAGTRRAPSRGSPRPPRPGASTPPSTSGILYAGRGEDRRRAAVVRAGGGAPGTPRRRSRSASRGCGTGTSGTPSGICGARRAAAAPRPRTGWPRCSTRGGRRRPRMSSGSRRTRRPSARSGTSGRRPRGIGGRRCGSGCWPPAGATWWRRPGGTGRPRRPGPVTARSTSGCCWPGRGVSREAARVVDPGG